MFVEEVYKFDTTLVTSDEFTGLKDDWELVEGQGPAHITSHDIVLNWWKENQNLSLATFMKTQRTPLEHYVYDTENPEKNFNLARWYHEQGQTASAISLYLAPSSGSLNKGSNVL